MKLNRIGTRTGMSPKPTGADSKLSKEWDLYHNHEFVATYKGLTEISKVIGKSPQYCWQMAHHYTSGYQKGHPCMTKEGYRILQHGLEYGYWLKQDGEE